jgi:hypothetical protein
LFGLSPIELLLVGLLAVLAFGSRLREVLDGSQHRTAIMRHKLGQPSAKPLVPCNWPTARRRTGRRAVLAWSMFAYRNLF